MSMIMTKVYSMLTEIVRVSATRELWQHSPNLTLWLIHYYFMSWYHKKVVNGHQKAQLESRLLKASNYQNIQPNSNYAV